MGKKKERITWWTNSDGNRCFRFSERKEFERPWIIIIVAILLLVAVGVEYMLNGSYYSLTPAVIAFFFLFLWWTIIPLKANEDVIEKSVHDLMDNVVSKDAEAVGTKVKKSYVHYDIKGTYAIIKGRCFLVLLENGDVWEYPLTYHHATDEKDGYYECGTEYEVSDNLEHIRAIKPQRWKQFVAKLNISEKSKLWLLVFIIVTIGGLAFAGVFWLVMELKWWSLLVVGGYVAIETSVGWMTKAFPGRAISVFKHVVDIPFYFVCLVVSLTQPFITIVGTYFFIGMFVFGVPAIVLVGVSKMGWLTLRPETIAFIVLALGSVLCSTYAVAKWIIRHTPLKNWGNHTYEGYREQLAFYLAHPSNMVFMLYLIYFVLLAVSGYMLIQNGQYLISERYDLAILKAFLVFIAYTNMKVKAKETEVDAKELLHRISELFEHDKYE